MYRKLTDTDGQEGVMDGEAQQQLKLRIYEATIEEFREISLLLPTLSQPASLFPTARSF